MTVRAAGRHRAQRIAAARWTALGTVLLVLTALAGYVVLRPSQAHAAATPVSTFTKTGTDTRTNSSSDSGAGTTGTAQPGDTINWVLDYTNNTGAPANVDITDPITNGQTFVPGSLRTPGLTGRYSTDGGATYSTTEPVSGVNAVGATGTVTPHGISVATSQPTSLISPASGTGDGWQALYYNDDIYVVHHHHPALDAGATLLDCFDKFTGQECPGYQGGGVNVNTQAGTPFFQGNASQSNIITPTMNFGYLDRNTGRLYFAATPVNSNQAGVQCLDLAAQQSCGFTAELTLPYVTNLSAQPGKMTGGAVVGSRYYTLGADGRVYCYDTTTNAVCAGWTPVQADPTHHPADTFEADGSGATSLSQIVSFGGSRLWVGIIPGGGEGAGLSCVDIATGALCPGYPQYNISRPDAQVLAPVLDNAGNDVGGCLISSPVPTVANFLCYDLNGNAIADPYPQLAPGWVSWRTQGGVLRIGTRVYLAYMNPNIPADTNGDIQYECFDFATGQACAGFNSPVQQNSGLEPYTLTQDPYAPTCLWEDGNAGQPQAFSADSGALGCSALIGNVRVTPASNFCDGLTTHVTGWDAIHIDGIASNQYSSAAITITDANGNIVPGWDGTVVPSTTQTIDISSIPVTGATSTLTVRVGLLDAAPGASARIRVTYAGDDQVQVCYQTRVDSVCPATSNATVDDNANAVTSVPGGVSDAPGGNSSGTASFAVVPAAGECSLHVQKRVDRTTAQPGQTVTWRIDIQNTGTLPYPTAGWTDSLTQLLDDATYNNDAAVTAGPGSVSYDAGTDTLSWTGALAVNDTATVTFTATVADTPAPFADHDLPNTVVSAPSSNCAPGSTDPDCTTDTTVPDLLVAKFSSPASTATVNEGDLVTYSLSFDNTQGRAPAVVDWTDDLSKVLDDATVVAQPAATGALVTGPIAGGAFTVSGTVAAGQLATVTYQVRVDRPDTGDHQLDNFLVPTGTAPPPSCLPSNPDCTTNPVPDLQVSKSVDPASTTPVNEGDRLTFSLTFSNANGKAPADVDYVDDVSKVVDDATITSQPAVASGFGLTVGNVVAGQFTISGQIQPGQTTIVTYQVQVDSPDNGDHQLDNFLFPSGSNPPPTCQPGNPLCTTNPVPDLVVSKDASPASTTPVKPGDSITYQLTFDNSAGKAPASVNWLDDLSKVLDDATVTGAPTGSPGLVVGPVTGGRFAITGTVGAGLVSTVIYTVRVDDPDTGDFRLDNFLLQPGTNPPPSCLPSDPLCTTHPVPDLVVSKSVDPASTTPVNQGQQLTYSLAFDNTKGQAAAAVDYVDELAKVLDDATVTTAPAVSSGSGLTVGSISGGRFTITGQVPAGEKTVVTYVVTVDDPDTGDHRLDNFLVPAGGMPPPTCLPSDPDCTTNPVPDLVVSKSVDPVTTTPVNEGDTLNYTITLDNSKGRAAAAVDYTDHLAKVLDDATVTSDPTLASGSGLTVGPISGGTFRITGTLAAGATATVTYSVKVDKPDTGDHQLDNFVAVGNTPPPPTCEPSNELCTTNPDPALKVAKTVDPPSGTTVHPSDLLTYTLSFDNSAGKAAAPVQWTDDLSDLLDDAHVVTAPQLATGSGLTVGPIDSHGVFPITGHLEAGASATVTYQVRVDDPDNGNGKLNNYLEPGDTPPPPSCVEDSTLCTINVTAHKPPNPSLTGLLVNPLAAIALGSVLLAGGVLVNLAGRRRRTGRSG